jgi:hypothetical protein
MGKLLSKYGNALYTFIKILKSSNEKVFITTVGASNDKNLFVTSEGDSFPLSLAGVPIRISEETSSIVSFGIFLSDIKIEGLKGHDFKVEFRDDFSKKNKNPTLLTLLRYDFNTKMLEYVADVFRDNKKFGCDLLDISTYRDNISIDGEFPFKKFVIVSIDGRVTR